MLIPKRAIGHHTQQAAKDLHRAPVPAAMGEYLVFALERRLHEFGFNLVSHLLANLDFGSKWGPDYPRVTRANLKVLGGPRNECSLTKAIEAMEEAEIIKVYPGGVKHPNHIILTDHMRSLAKESEDKRLFATFEEYVRRSPIVAKPKRGISRGIRQRFPEGVLNAVRALQHRQLNFDRVRCMVELGDPKIHLSDRQQLLRWALKLHDGPNYTQYHLAESGRLQSGSPSLQNVPGVMRQWFYPDPGYSFLDVDYKTQEIRILAHVSGDLELQRDVASTSEDIYEQARMVVRLPRAVAKEMLNALVYGGSAITLSEIAGRMGKGDAITNWSQLSEARRLRAWFQKRYPVATAWIEARAEEIQHQGWAYGYDGFARRILGDEARTAGVNHIIQATGAAILRVVLVELDRLLGDLGMVLLPLHDGLLLQVREDAYDDAVAIVCQVMETAPGRVPQGIQFSGPHMGALRFPVKIKKGWYKDNAPPKGANAIPSRATPGSTAGGA